MGLRFFRRVRLGKGLTLNLSKTGASLSMGPRGAKFTMGTSGKRVTAGLPGTGLFYTSKLDGGKKQDRSGSSPRQNSTAIRSRDRLNPGFFKRLFISAEEQDLIDGLRELVEGNETTAMHHLRKATQFTDVAFISGFLAFKHAKLPQAQRLLEHAVERSSEIGQTLQRYQVQVFMSMPLTPELDVHIDADLRSALLGLAEVRQQMGNMHKAREALEQLHRYQPDDIVVRLSLAEIIMEGDDADQQALQEVVRLGEGVGNDTSYHAALLLYKGRALQDLGLHIAARDTFTKALRRRKDRPTELLNALRYARSLTYHELGKKSRAHQEWEKLYASAPDYADVAQRLGLE
jgi:tetratricopeptide (TPR) repeat protein